jgi:hypothetical protein
MKAFPTKFSYTARGGGENLMESHVVMGRGGELPPTSIVVHRDLVCDGSQTDHVAAGGRHNVCCNGLQYATAILTCTRVRRAAVGR